MLGVGLVVTLAGFGIAVLSLGVTDSPVGRLLMVLVGIAISLVGIMGFVNQHYLKNANWRR